jgi:hypothetical protein
VLIYGMDVKAGTYDFLEVFVMLVNDESLKGVFDGALSYGDYVASGTDAQEASWGRVYEAASLDSRQAELLGGFVREMKVLVVSGIWCGDCVEQGPLLGRIAEGSEVIDLRIVDRDSEPALRDSIMINEGQRVPMVLFMAEDYAFCGCYGDRVLSRYRRIVEQQVGASCSTGLFVPEVDSMAADLQCWLNEFERIQWMLRSSARLREKHGD